MIDADYLLARLIDLVKTPSPVGMTERAVALVDTAVAEMP